jgi:hypothetical protein
MALFTNVLRNNFNLNSVDSEYIKFYGNVDNGRSYFGSLIGSKKMKDTSQLQDLKQQNTDFNLYYKGNDPRKYYLVDSNNVYYDKFKNKKPRLAESSINYWDVPLINELDSTAVSLENSKKNKFIIKHSDIINKYIPQRTNYKLKNIV